MELIVNVFMAWSDHDRRIIMKTSCHENAFCIAGLLWGKKIGGFPSQRVSNANRWCLLWSLLKYNRVAGDLWRPWHSYDFIITLNVWGPSFLSLTWSISWLLMPWLLSSPGHQQPWYWTCWIGWPFSYLKTDFNHLCYANVEEWHKM